MKDLSIVSVMNYADLKYEKYNKQVKPQKLIKSERIQQNNKKNVENN